ncbi:DUF4141 domain-containing protein [Thioalkalivibrio sp. ALE19]|uniref:DUF4141 domain-containing protein n=1 Tax=Thioalkalivibrio sp. ALE19 TaxID=1266909 RepID=UPI0018C95693|nr:DUF4141 domain-containing protein [Thioalkalivibrio sp. ALE19]
MKSCEVIFSRKTGIVLAMVAVMSLGAGKLSAQWAVIDGTNLVQNIENVVENARQYEQMIREYQTQLEEYQRNFQQLEDFGDGVSGARDQYEAHRQAAEDLYGSLREADEFVDEIYRDFALSDVETWEEYHEMRSRQEEQGQARARNQAQHASMILDDIDNQYQEIDRFESQARTIDGQTQGYQQLSSQLALISRQNAQVIELLSQQNIEEGAQQTKEEAAEKAVRERRKEETEAYKERATERYEASKEHFRETMEGFGLETN